MNEKTRAALRKVVAELKVLPTGQFREKLAQHSEGEFDVAFREMHEIQEAGPLPNYAT